MTTNPTSVACPNCQAKPGQPCTQPTDTGRKVLNWYHSARFDAWYEWRWEQGERRAGQTVGVYVRLSLDIDADEWTANYGVSGSREIREDVTSYVENLVREQLRKTGVLIESSELRP